MELLIIIALILINGFFAMSELSLVSSRRFKLDSAAKRGNGAAKTALELSDNPTKFLSTVQIGITLIGILLGVFSGDTITKTWIGYISKIELLAPFATNIGTGLSVLFITYLSIVLGELFPKRVGMTFPEPIAIIVAKPMLYLSKLTSPFVWLLIISNNFLLKVFGISKTKTNKISEEEIKAIIKESADGGEIQEIEHDIVERIFELGDKKVNTLYTPRNNITYLNISDNWSIIKNKINSDKHSAYPVCYQNNLDRILGIVLLKDLFDDSHEMQDLSKVMKQPLFIHINTSAFKVLEQFKREKMHYGIVINEYDETMGIITMDDLMDAIIGNATEWEQSEYSITQISGNSWLADGYYSLSEFSALFGLFISSSILHQYTTITGLFIHYKQSIPNIGDIIFIDNYSLQVVDKDGTKVDKILITLVNKTK